MTWPILHYRKTPAGVAEGAAHAGDALLTRLLAARGLVPAMCDFALASLPAPAGLVSPAAVELLLSHREKRLLVVADYDADGATACAVMVRGLKLLGFRQVEFLVPDRQVHGYGLTPALVEEAADLAPDLIITVDNGIASLAGVQAAQARGMAVLVTDHHLPGKELPACVIVNPRLVPDFPARELAGVGVAFYLLLAVRAALRARGDMAGAAPLATLLDLVALGTVADVVVLDAANRILVEQGLRRMRAGVACMGLRALVRVAKREEARLTSADLGFSLGPRLNAAGRLADMRHGIECLLADDAVTATQLAEELDAINRDRRLIERDMLGEAETQLARLRARGSLPPVLCLYSADWHEGVVGLVASRVKELCQRPVFAFADAQAKGWLKGSGRSIKGLHLRDALAELAVIAPDLLSRFGGHAMAAGLSLARPDLERFRQGLERVVSGHLPNMELAAEVTVDGTLADTELTLANAESITFGMPWGQGLPAPLFHGVFEVLNQRLLGDRHLKLALGLPATNGVIDAICFNVDTRRWPDASCRRVELVYRLESNCYQGRVSAQLLVEHLRPAQVSA